MNKGKIATDKDKANDILGYGPVIGLAVLVGLIGGFLFGIWDSITVIIDRGIPINALRDMLSLSVYSAAIYTIVGCLGMAVIGAASGSIIRAGEYRASKSQLSKVFIGVFILLAVSALLAENFVSGNIIDIIESTVIGILSGVGVAALSISLIYILTKGIRREKSIALSISLFFFILALLYGSWVLNWILLPRGTFYLPISIVTNIVLLILVIIVAIGLYILSVFIMRRYNLRVYIRAGYILLTIILCVFITISFIGPFTNTQDAPVTSGTANGKPNVLWIVMDTVRADHLSCYDYQLNTTPNIDRIASEGILFENAISAAPWTLPSHASMFTSMFPSKHGTHAEHQWLDDDFQTIAEVLGLNGYRTFGFSNNWYVHPRTNLSQDFDAFEALNMGKIIKGSGFADSLKASDFILEFQNRLVMDDGAHQTNKVVKKWIADAHKDNVPFFVFINYMEAHSPYHPPGNYLIPYLNDDEDLKKVRSVNRDGVGYITEKLPMNDEDFRILRALYDGELTYLDYKMGQLFDYLRELNILDNTILIITADHGENFGDHHLMGHILCVYDTLVHVPLVIRYPQVFKTGLRINEQVRTIDIFPTILDIAGIDWDGKEQIQGCSLLTDREQCQSTYIIAEHWMWHKVLEDLRIANHEFDFTIYARNIKTIRTEEYKYIWASDGRDELYNIRLDPDELNNLIDTEPEIAMEMKEQLIDWLNSFEPYRPETAQKVK